jgi:hypothetical protein
VVVCLIENLLLSAALNISLNQADIIIQWQHISLIVEGNTS